MPQTEALYDHAEARVRQLFGAEEVIAFCLADWPEGDEHWRWLLTATEQEIRDWAAAGMA